MPLLLCAEFILQAVFWKKPPYFISLSYFFSNFIVKKFVATFLQLEKSGI